MLRAVCGYALFALYLHSQATALDPKLVDLAKQIYAAKDAPARAALLDQNKDLATEALAHTLNELAGQQYDRRALAEALRMYETACEVADRIGSRKETATCTFDRGLIESRLSRNEPARQHLEQAIALFEKMDEPKSIANALNTLAVLVRNTGDYRDSVSYFQRALVYAEKSGEVSIAQTNTNLGVTYTRLGNFRAAIECLQKALAVTQRRGMQRETSLILNNLGSAYYEQGDIELSLPFLEESLAIKEKAGDLGDIATSVMNVGAVLEHMGKTARAAEYYERAIKLAEDPSLVSVLVEALYDYGNMLFHQGERVRSREMLARSLELSEKGAYGSGVGYARIGLARLHTEDHHPDRALELARQAADSGRQSGQVGILVNALDAQAQALVALDQPEAAEAALQEAIQAVETTRTQLPGDQQASAHFMEDRRSVFLNMVRLQLKLKKPEAALAYVERGKARALLDTLKLGNPSVTKTMTPDEGVNERKLAKNIESIRDAILRQSQRPNPDRKQLDEMGAQLEKARTEYRSFESGLYALHPRLKISRAVFDPVNAAALVSDLPDPAAALLEYSISEDGVDLFVITRPDELRVYRLIKKRQALQADVARFRRQIAMRDLDYRKLAGSLYHDLIEPAAAQLKGKTTLVISPDGFLWNLPFQALSPSPQRSLLEDRALFYTPSLTLLHETLKLHGAVRPAQPRLLAVSAAGTEIEGLRQIYGASRIRVLEGADADRDAIKREAPNYDVLHVAAHGVFDDRSPLSSYVMLGKSALEARELMDLNLRADMAVLSGCETGRGTSAGGEGLIGMAWALFVAGTPATVASQWKVESQSTSRLMVEFHKAAQREAKAKALRDAALAVMKNPEWRHPFYWSGFILVGQGF